MFSVFVQMTHLLLIQYSQQAIHCIFSHTFTPVSPNNRGLGFVVSLDCWWNTFIHCCLRDDEQVYS